MTVLACDHTAIRIKLKCSCITLVILKLITDFLNELQRSIILCQSLNHLLCLTIKLENTYKA